MVKPFAVRCAPSTMSFCSESGASLLRLKNSLKSLGSLTWVMPGPGRSVKVKVCSVRPSKIVLLPLLPLDSDPTFLARFSVLNEMYQGMAAFLEPMGVAYLFRSNALYCGERVMMPPGIFASVSLPLTVKLMVSCWYSAVALSRNSPLPVRLLSSFLSMALSSSPKVQVRDLFWTSHSPTLVPSRFRSKRCPALSRPSNCSGKPITK